MPIVIKEVMVKTTVERKTLQWSQPAEDALKALKQEILAELAEDVRVQHTRKYKKDRLTHYGRTEEIGNHSLCGQEILVGNGQ